MISRVFPWVNWLTLSALAAVLTLVATLVAGWDRALWYDEVFTLGAAAPGRPIDWTPILNDVHPPGHILLVRAASGLVGDGFALRTVNLIGLILLAAALPHYARALGRDRLALLVLLTLCNGFALTMLIELRAYFLLYAGAVLGHGLLLTLSAARPHTLPLFLLGAALATLHYFGAAIGMALLNTAAALHLRAGRVRAALPVTAGIGLVVAAVLSWILFSKRRGLAAYQDFWIGNDPVALADTLSHLPLLALLLVLIAAFRTEPGAGQELRRHWLAALAPPAMVFATALAISLVVPVVSYRNLIVCVPGLTLAAALACPQSLLDRLKASALTLLVAVLVGLYLTNLATRDIQMVAWAVRTAGAPGCDGVPIHVIRPDVVDEMAQELFTPDRHRPLRDITTVDPAATMPEDCPIIAMGWHQDGTVDQLQAFFAARGMPVDILPPPNDRLARQGTLFPGFVVRRRQ
ncbi:MAG: hypothetical protein AAGE76_12240 [Pseudomonadota bacterium]